MIRFQPSSISISRKDLQYHLEGTPIRQRNQTVQSQKCSVERSVIQENQAATVSSSLPSFGSYFAVQESGLGIAMETKLNYSPLRKDNRNFRGPSSTSSSGISAQSQVSRRRGSVKSQHLDNIQNNQAIHQDHHIHQSSGTISVEGIISHPFLRQHDSSFCGINSVGELISSHYLFRDMVDSFASLALQRPSKASLNLIHENQERMFRTQQSFTEPDIHHIESFLPKSVPEAKLAFSPCPPLQFSFSIPSDSNLVMRLFELPEHNLQFNNSHINTRTDAEPYPALILHSYSGQRRGCKVIYQANTMKDNSKKRKEDLGHRRAQTLPNNTNEVVRTAVPTNVSATAQHRNLVRQDEQHAESEQILGQPQAVGEEVQRCMKDYRGMVRWKPWFEAQQLFLNTSGKQFSVGRPGERPILVSEPTWLQQQASSMSEEAIQSAKQVLFKGYQPACAEEDDNSENARPAAKEQTIKEHDNVNPLPLASSKQTLAEHIAYRNKKPPKRRNSEPAVLADFYQIAFKSSLEFADHILDATYYVNEPNWDTAFDFGYLALQDRPIEEWHRL